MRKEEEKQVINPFFDIRVEDVQTIESRQLIPRKAIFNTETDEVVGIVSEKYSIIDNKALCASFEEYLKESDVKFQRLDAWINKTGSRFWAKYRFPEISVELDGGVDGGKDKIDLMLILQNSYNGSAEWGFDFGGYRLVCLNGLRVFDAMYKFRGRHIGIDQQDVEDQIFLDFETVKQIFMDNLAKTWKEMIKTDFNRARALTFLRTVELGKLYRNKLYRLYFQKKNEMKTMWDFYQMVTWFTTHVIEHRNAELARRVAAQANNAIAV